MNPRLPPQFLHKTFTMKRQQSYEKVAQSLEDEFWPRAKSPTQSHNLLSLLLATTCLVLAITALTRVFTSLESSKALKSHTSLTCGTTVAEAKKRGCTFDVLTKYWLPAECPRTGAKEYLEIGGNFYKDYLGRERLTEENIANLAGTEDFVRSTLWYTEERDHLAHCAFMFLRIAQSVHDGSRLDAYSANIDHARHCKRSLFGVL
jgi:hypothetical protein